MMEIERKDSQFNPKFALYQSSLKGLLENHRKQDMVDIDSENRVTNNLVWDTKFQLGDHYWI